VRKVAFVLLAFMIAGPSNAGLMGLVKKIDTTWIVEPALDLGAEKLIKVGEVVSITRLLPERVVVLDGPVLNEAGQAVLPGGEQLYSRGLEGNMAYCSTSGRKMTKTGYGPPNSSDDDPCFFDTNGDGRFDKSFRIDTYNATIFGRAIRYGKDVHVDGSYHEIPRTEWKQDTFIGVRYTAKPIYSGQPVFSVGLGGKEIPLASHSDFARFLGFSGPIGTGIAKEGEQRRIEILGASFLILGINKDGLRVRVERAIPAQPFKFRYNS